ncbi:MAG: hypothetical protein NTY64_12765 [Deltaproteobacteria bacterium]|nr:hypothetical protein [Deltaproteobacteria bacterium]
MSGSFDGFVKSPSAALRFTFVAEAYHPGTPHSGGFARRVPRNAGELFTKPSLWRFFTRLSVLTFGFRICFGFRYSSLGFHLREQKEGFY